MNGAHRRIIASSTTCPEAIAVSTWKIDPAHTDILFSAKHMMVTTVRGKFDVVEGELELDEAEPTNSRGEIRASAASVSTGQERRNVHLRSADFLDAEHHPWVVAKATGIERLGDRYRVQVDLTIRDQTRPVAFDGEFLGFYPAMSGSGRRAGFHFEAALSRNDWGLTWNMALEAGGWLVGDEIHLEIDIAADETAAVVAGA
jgi:polyisoprenoid-binding protein YceI